MHETIVRNTATLVLAGCAMSAALPSPAETSAGAEFNRVEETIVGFAETAAIARLRPLNSDAPEIRERVRRLAVHVSRTCAGTDARYELQPVSADLGPSLSAEAGALKSDYFYPKDAGLSLELSGDGPGAALSVRSEQGPPRRLGTLAREEGPCRPYPSVLAGLETAGGVSATISVEPRTGFFRPACYKDPVNGFHKLDIWTVLTLIFPQEIMTVKSADGMSFRDKQSCLDYYERARTNR